jgi:hypothetical protein
MNTTTAALTATIGASLIVRDAAGAIVFQETRPVSFGAADTALAFGSYGRTSAWDLDANGNVSAPVETIDNRFNGTPAARIDAAIGTTHTEFRPAQAKTVLDGDLISDMELCEAYVVAGSRLEGETMRVHMVREGKTWADRFRTDFDARQFVMVARKR